MALETGTYINDLAPSNPLSSDPAGQGDDHLRLIKSTVQATLPNMGAVLGLPRVQDTAVSISSTWNTNLMLSTNSATTTVVMTLPPQASITAGFYVDFVTLAGANISVVPSAGGNVNNVASFLVPPESYGRAVFLGGVAWRAFAMPSGQGGLATVPALNVTGTATISGTVVLTIGQVKFPGTQVPSSDVNTLDDYEEGTWTPTLTFATAGNLNVVYSIRTGVYTKVGELVNCSCRVATSTFTHTTAAGDCRITGLPFSTKSVSNHTWSGTPGPLGGITSVSGDNTVTPVLDVTATYLRFSASNLNTGAVLTLGTSFFVTATQKDLSAAIAYQAA